MSQNDAFDSNYREGIEFHREGDHLNAIKKLEIALSYKPNDGRALYNLGNVFADVNQHEKAIILYDRAVSVDPSIPSVWYNKGNSHLELCQIDTAIVALDRATTLKPDYLEAWFNKGIAYKEAGNLMVATKCFETVVQLDDQFHPGWFNLACISAINNDIKKSHGYLKIAIKFQDSAIDYRESILVDPDFRTILDFPEIQQIISDKSD
ncbi:MAG: tetratricopeptide repeat protein [Candidatus Kariarchaeaceae archaeon]|jgi:tetratricopeptide (TPR) repeat protein